MKAVITLLLILSFGAVALAQNESTNAKVETTQMDIVLDSGAFSVISAEQTKAPFKSDMARLYKFKNSRVKKALSFTIKNNRPTLA